MDQIAALHWIQENIAVFGGDPSNVTLMGHGTGAACVGFLMASSAVPDGKCIKTGLSQNGRITYTGFIPVGVVKIKKNYNNAYNTFTTQRRSIFYSDCYDSRLVFFNLFIY